MLWVGMVVMLRSMWYNVVVHSSVSHGLSTCMNEGARCESADGMSVLTNSEALPVMMMLIAASQPFAEEVDIVSPHLQKYFQN